MCFFWCSAHTKVTSAGPKGAQAQASAPPATSSISSITKDDLEHLKQEIFTYIDKVKQEILEAIKSQHQKSGNNEGDEEEQ
jgi:DnaJ-domain-containing protein 1